MKQALDQLAKGIARQIVLIAAKTWLPTFRTGRIFTPRYTPHQGLRECARRKRRLDDKHLKQITENAPCA